MSNGACQLSAWVQDSLKSEIISGKGRSLSSGFLCNNFLTSWQNWIIDMLLMFLNCMVLILSLIEGIPAMEKLRGK